MRSFRYLLLALCPVLLATGCLHLQPPTPGQPPAAPASVSGIPVQVVKLPDSGTVNLAIGQCLTVDSLRGLQLDPHPPVLGKPARPYDKNLADDTPPGETPPYVADGIQPFRFQFFNNEFDYGGWHTNDLVDYASAHGFSLLDPYVRKPEEKTHLPAGTGWLCNGGGPDWDAWMPAHGIGKGRFDLLPDRDLVALLNADPTLLKDLHPQDWAGLMLDMEHACLAPADLRKQPWYPTSGGGAAFEKKYYHGYALTYVVPVQIARARGFKNISVYGWSPYDRAWYGLEKANPGGPDDWQWNNYGREIYSVVDIINNSVYCFYWSAQNVAYTLANTDLNMKLVNTMTPRKPVRPYFWTLMHGGGGGNRWWTEQPLASEEVRAMIAMSFFTGQDGFDCWNWSGTGSHITPPELKPDTFVIAKDSFAAAQEHTLGFKRWDFNRYDALHIVDAEKGGDVRFNRLEDAKPRPEVYVMNGEALRRHLRSSAEPIAAMVEALALVKPFEDLLRHGQVMIDVPAQELFKETAPISRRVKLGKRSLMITYDPEVVYGGSPRDVLLKDFDGHPGLTLDLPADDQTRVWLLEEG